MNGSAQRIRVRLLSFPHSHANDEQSGGNDAVVSAVVEEVRRQPLVCGVDFELRRGEEGKSRRGGHT